MRPSLHPFQYEDLVRAALREDLGGAGDLTTDAIVPADAKATGSLVVRAAGRVAGLDVALSAFRQLDAVARFDVRVPDGDDATAGSTLAVVSCSARALLSAERVALNLLGRLCGIATATRDVVRSIEGTRAKVVCTRKTTPLLRAVEKYAVRVGGGSNHRFGLDDAILVKDNHVAIAEGIAEAVRRVRAAAGHMVKVEVEVDTLDQLREALDLGVDAVLLDNMSLDTLGEAVRLARGRALTEASGGITPANARAVAETGVDLISLGWLTHSLGSLDVALDVASQ
jgi:nicotinate-nucleotide pyrophosphorylase (carboxylating)